jgi:hypothetical protein
MCHSPLSNWLEARQSLLHHDVRVACFVIRPIMLHRPKRSFLAGDIRVFLWKFLHEIDLAVDQTGLFVVSDYHFFDSHNVATDSSRIHTWDTRSDDLQYDYLVQAVVALDILVILKILRRDICIITHLGETSVEPPISHMYAIFKAHRSAFSIL